LTQQVYEREISVWESGSFNPDKLELSEKMKKNIQGFIDKTFKARKL
jgi:hypothetical protein